MSFSDFRHITVRGTAPKAERLFRAAIAAFCALTRPTRREIAQLDDLALPLFDQVSAESKRYVAAALSECKRAPEGLIRRLCDESVDIAAPLLMRSPMLTDVDLVALIGRHGAPHARAIGRRAELHPTIADLVATIERKAAALRLVAREGAPVTEPPAEHVSPKVETIVMAETEATPEAVPGEAAEEIRERLRAMMRPAGEHASAKQTIEISSFVRLRDTALTGRLVFFQTALADALDLDFQTAREITGGASWAPLAAALRALDLTEEQAYLVAAAAYPALFPHPEAIRLFLDRYRTLHRDVAVEQMRVRRLDAIGRQVEHNGPKRPAAIDQAANCDNAEPASDRLTARGSR